MAQTLQKLSPDRDLQCYFFQPSAIAALSGTSPSGFTLSGTWRQQFDWAVVEWNRDNVFEHPMFRNLPDGDLSGLTLSYEETRSNCIPLDSSLFPTVDWPTLRIWANDGSGEKVYKVPLSNYATPIEGSYQPATAQVTLGGTVTPGDVVGIAFLDEHYPYVMTANPLEFAVQNIVAGVNGFSPTMTATQNGTSIQLSYVGAGSQARNTAQSSTTGAEGNRLGLYTYASGSQTEQWNAATAQFSGGNLSHQMAHHSYLSRPWSILCWALFPLMQYERCAGRMRRRCNRALIAGVSFRFPLPIGTLTGTGRTYSIAGPGSRRINDDSTAAVYTGNWTSSIGNFSGGTIHVTSTTQSAVTVKYTSAQTHTLYLGTRMAASGAPIQASVDGQDRSRHQSESAGGRCLNSLFTGSAGRGYP